MIDEAVNASFGSDKRKLPDKLAEAQIQSLIRAKIPGHS
jgi:hypothetical protein